MENIVTTVVLVFLIVAFAFAFANKWLPRYFCSIRGWHVAPPSESGNPKPTSGVCPRCGKWIVRDLDGWVSVEEGGGQLRKKDVNEKMGKEQAEPVQGGGMRPQKKNSNSSGGMGAANRSLGKKDKEDKELAFAFDMIRKFLRINESYLMYSVVDEGRLPCTKRALKSSIKYAILHIKNEEHRESMRETFCLLAKYQSNSTVEENRQRISMEAYEMSAGLDGIDRASEERTMGLLTAAYDESVALRYDEKRELLAAELDRWELDLHKKDIRGCVES